MVAKRKDVKPNSPVRCTKYLDHRIVFQRTTEMPAARSPVSPTAKFGSKTLNETLLDTGLCMATEDILFTQVMNLGSSGCTSSCRCLQRQHRLCYDAWWTMGQSMESIDGVKAIQTDLPTSSRLPERYATAYTYVNRLNLNQLLLISISKVHCRRFSSSLSPTG